jgi:leucine dehydrogenase
MQGGMERLIREWDGECVITRFDESTGSWVFIALHDRTLGPALGGCRMMSYATPRDALRDAMRLAAGMTMKWACVDLPFGGGKSVLAVPRPLAPTEREGLLLRFGSLIESLNGIYGTGADFGTGRADMDIIGRRTRHVCGRSPGLGGHGDPGPWTALGVLAGLRAACDAAFGTRQLTGRSVLVQGLGGVGGPLCRLLAAEGARVLVTDAMPAKVAVFAGELDATPVPPEEAYETECDVFAPCAIGGILNRRSIRKLRCVVVGGSANNQLEDEIDAERLHDRSILWAPDFVINAGGAIAHAGLELLGWNEMETKQRVLRIEESITEILAMARAGGASPLPHAKAVAERVLARERGQQEPELPAARS